MWPTYTNASKCALRVRYAGQDSFYQLPLGRPTLVPVTCDEVRSSKSNIAHSSAKTAQSAQVTLQLTSSGLASYLLDIIEL